MYRHMYSARPALQRLGTLQFEDARGLGVSGRSSVGRKAPRTLATRYRPGHHLTPPVRANYYPGKESITLFFRNLPT